MPFRSEAQRRYLYATHPEVAKKFQKETPKGTTLPQYVKNRDHHKTRAKKAYFFGFSRALENYKLTKSASVEVRLKIPQSASGKFHGLNNAWKKASSELVARNPSDGNSPADLLAMAMDKIDEPGQAVPQAAVNRLDRQTAWGPQTNVSPGTNATIAGSALPSDIAKVF